jgi:hypothetical protein
VNNNMVIDGIVKVVDIMTLISYQLQPLPDKGYGAGYTGYRVGGCMPYMVIQW